MGLPVAGLHGFPTRAGTAPFLIHAKPGPLLRVLEWVRNRVDAACMGLHKENRMFPEYRELITQLKTSDLHFRHLFDQHNGMDQQIRNLEAHVDQAHARPEAIEALKKQKLQLKDQLYQILRKHKA